MGDLVAQELHQREIDSGLTSAASPPHSPRSKNPTEHAPASNESGYKSSPHPSDTGNFIFTIKNWLITNDSDHLIGTLSDPGICQENDVIRQGVQQLQNKINQFQRRDGLGGSPLIRDSDHLIFFNIDFFQSVEFNQSDWSSSMIRNDTVLNSSESLTTTSLPMTQWEWLCLF